MFDPFVAFNASRDGVDDTFDHFHIRPCPIGNLAIIIDTFTIEVAFKFWTNALNDFQIIRGAVRWAVCIDDLRLRFGFGFGFL